MFFFSYFSSVDVKFSLFITLTFLLKKRFRIFSQMRAEILEENALVNKI